MTISIIQITQFATMGDDDLLKISNQTLKLVKIYAPDMGISFPVDEGSLYRIYNNFYGEEVSFAMEAEEIKGLGGEWESIENISNMFANAADELSAFDESDNPDYEQLSKQIEEIVLDPNEEYPPYRQWYTKDGKTTDF